MLDNFIYKFCETVDNITDYIVIGVMRDTKLLQTFSIEKEKKEKEKHLKNLEIFVKKFR